MSNKHDANDASRQKLLLEIQELSKKKIDENFKKSFLIFKNFVDIKIEKYLKKAWKELSEQEMENLFFIVNSISDRWKVLMRSGRLSSLQDKLLILERLLEGFSEEDIIKAFEGCTKSDFHNGKLNGKVYNSINLICRNGDNINRFISYNDMKVIKKDNFWDGIL